jgi:hypothetical protein
MAVKPVLHSNVPCENEVMLRPESMRKCLTAALQCNCGVAALPGAEQKQVPTHCNVAPAIIASRQHHVAHSF